MKTFGKQFSTNLGIGAAGMILSISAGMGVAGEQGQADLQSEAQRHYQSYVDTGALPDFANTHPEADRQSAYDFQDAFTAAFQQAGDTVVGYKLGFTGKTAPPGAEAPLLGRLMESQQVPVDQPFKLAEMANPILEVELAFQFAQDVPADAGVEQIRQAVGKVAACIEMPNPHYTQKEHFHGLNFIAHNVVSRRYKIFDWVPLEQVGDLGDLQVTLTRPDGRAVEFASAEVLPEEGQHHWSALHFAVEELAERNQRIDAGQIVITGSMGKALAAAKDDSGEEPETTLHQIEPGKYSVDYGQALGEHTFTVQAPE